MDDKALRKALKKSSEALEEHKLHQKFLSQWASHAQDLRESGKAKNLNMDTYKESYMALCYKKHSVTKEAERIDNLLAQQEADKKTKYRREQIQAKVNFKKQKEMQEKEEQERNFQYRKALLDKEIELERLREKNNRRANEDMRNFYNDMKKDL